MLYYYYFCVGTVAAAVVTEVVVAVKNSTYIKYIYIRKTLENYFRGYIICYVYVRVSSCAYV